LNGKAKDCFGEIYKRSEWDELEDYIPLEWDEGRTFSDMEVTIALEQINIKKAFGPDLVPGEATLNANTKQLMIKGVVQMLNERKCP
jgi:hypothetical protein